MMSTYKNKKGGFYLFALALGVSAAERRGGAGT